jgi:choline monooxygenase
MLRAMTAYHVDGDIAVASTLDHRFYRDPAAWELARERVFARTWQWIGDLVSSRENESLTPHELLPGLLAEPLLLARDSQGDLRCLSNVCTHRGNILVNAPCKAGQIRCGYHSRRFDLTGKMTFMPEFGDAKNFPRPEDHLRQVPFATWMGHGFASVHPVAMLEAVMADMNARIDWMPVASFRHDPKRDREFDVHAHWALYVENYLEGFHIPFVHAGLNAVVDYGTYASEIFTYSNLQLALAKEGEPAFDLPATSPDTGKRVAAYYWWIFPNLMLNFYPWGLSLNLVEPRGMDRTRVLFRTYVWDEAKLDAGAGSSLDRVEMEDEAVVQAVQRGVRSRFYPGGRYSPTREQGVHHFHRLLCKYLKEDPA